MMLNHIHVNIISSAQHHLNLHKAHRMRSKLVIYETKNVQAPAAANIQTRVFGLVSYTAQKPLNTGNPNRAAKPSRAYWVQRE